MAAALVGAVLGAAPAQAQIADIIRPGDPITAIGATPSATDVVANAIDNNSATKYANADGVNSGFVVTPSRGATFVSGFRFTTGSDAPERDPLTFKLEGSNNGGASYTLLLNNQSTGLGTDPGRQRASTTLSYNSPLPNAYTSYRLTVQTIRSTTSNTTAQYSEFELLGLIAKGPLDITTPGDSITIFGGSSTAGEDVTKVIDNNVGTKYLNTTAVNTGFVVTPSKGATTVTGLRLFTANDASERDPLTFKLEGSNDNGTSYTTIVATGNTGLATNPGRLEAGDTITFSNNVSYKSYRFTVLSVRNNPSTNLSQYSDIELLGLVTNGATDVTTPGDTITIYNGSAPANESPANAIDNTVATKYYNGTANSGFVVRPTKGLTVVTGLRLFTGNDSPERDPLNFTLEGSNDNGTTYTTIVNNGITGLNADPGRQVVGETIQFSNSTYYTSYRFSVQSTRNSGATQYSEIELLGLVAPSVSIGNASIAEGDTGTKTLSLPLTLSAASAQAVTVTYNTTDGTATAGSDYVGVTGGTATIAAGQTTGTIGITINGDTTLEQNETFTVTLTAATGATLGTPVTATGTIINDDVETPSLVVNTLSDVVSNTDGLTSLREALTYANRTTNQSAETITFTVTGTIRLTSALPSVASATTSGALTISNTQAGTVTLSGDANNSGTNDTGDVRLFSVDANANLTLNNLNLTGGRAEGSSPANSGGAILNNGTLALTGCTLTGNAAQLGGAIWSGSTLSIDSASSLSGNTTINSGSGSALYVGSGTASVNGTIASNNTTVVASGATLAGTGNVSGSVSIASGATHAPGNSGPGLQNTGNYLNSGVLSLDIAGTGVGTTYDQVNVTGTVGLAGTLRIVLPAEYTPTNGDQFVVINNDGSDAISAPSGLPEGSLVYSVDGRVTFQVSYNGGDGNDLVLTVASIRGNGTSPVLISEFRLSGPGGITDEYIELINLTGRAVALTGWTLNAGTVNTTLSGLDLTGKSIPAYGHLLITNSGYTLGSGAIAYPSTYPLGSTTPSAYATGDVVYSGDIALGSTLTLSNGSTLVDSVGDLSGTVGLVATNQYAFVRRQDGAAIVDTDNDTNDFNLVDTASTKGPPTDSGVSTLVAGARLGTPAPQNASSPIGRASLTLVPLDPATNQGIVPDGRYPSRGSSLDPFGRLTLRRTITNFSNQTIKQIRFTLVRTTAGNGVSSGSGQASGIADLRAITSVGVSANGSKVVQAIQIEAPTTPTTPSNQLSSNDTGNGGGHNASWNVGTLPAGGLAPGQSMNVEFVFGIVKEGNYNTSVVISIAN